MLVDSHFGGLKRLVSRLVYLVLSTGVGKVEMV